MPKQRQKHRNKLLTQYGHRYERHWSSRPGCFYCGDSWSQLDHCPPLSWCDTKDLQWFKERKIGFYLVNSCKDCNQALSDKPFFTLQERADFIRKRLESKSEKVVLWNRQEIAEMSARFQKTIEARQALQNILLERLWFAQELQFKAEDFPI
jgi:hypothetical protein